MRVLTSTPSDLPTYEQARRDARQVVVCSLTMLLMALPLVLGFGIEAAALNAFGIAWACLVWRRFRSAQRRRRSKAGDRS